jgi:NAD(P)-dependent dehydrogenase (short-subunit alcohol dehydrogenase family)
MTGTVLITGANRGIGLALARAYAGQGWSVIATARDPAAADDLLTLVRAHPARVRIEKLDLENFSDIDALAAGFAGRPIDVLLANGALTGGPADRFGATDYDHWVRSFKVNAMAQLRLAEAFADSVTASRRKVMFFVSSRMGVRTFGGVVGYMSSKHALNFVVFHVADCLKEQGVIAVAAHPGHVATRAARYRGALTPEESAAALITIIARLMPADSGKFFDPDGSELQLITRQMNPNAFGAMTAGDNATLRGELADNQAIS